MLRYLAWLLLPRVLHKWYADTFGYFWIPCPLCSELFGGHEWGGDNYEYDSIYECGGKWKGICRKCASTNKERYEREWEQFNRECDEIGQRAFAQLEREQNVES